jgi:hypothetical protein
MSETSDAFRQLADALTRRLAIISDREFYHRDAAAHLRQLQMISGEIANLARQLPAGTDPQLIHYLQRCSYDKALAFLKAQ